MPLVEFILQSRLAAYPGGNPENKREFDDGATGFEIISDKYRYLDRYYGFNPFVGAEHVYQDGTDLLWAMNYFGKILSDNAGPNEIYGFLKEALRCATPDYPFRGPDGYNAGNFRYENLQHGKFNSFHGIENIYFADEKVYTLYYHGGIIKPDTE